MSEQYRTARTTDRTGTREVDTTDESWAIPKTGDRVALHAAAEIVNDETGRTEAMTRLDLTGATIIRRRVPAPDEVVVRTAAGTWWAGRADWLVLDLDLTADESPDPARRTEVEAERTRQR